MLIPPVQSSWPGKTCVATSTVQTCSAGNGPKPKLRTTNHTNVSARAVGADHRRCCQLRTRRPISLPYVHAAKAHTSSTTATNAESVVVHRRGEVEMEQ